MERVDPADVVALCDWCGARPATLALLVSASGVRTRWGEGQRVLACPDCALRPRERGARVYQATEIV